MVSGHRLHFAPPLITTEEQLNWALEIVDRAAAVVDQAVRLRHAPARRELPGQ